MVNEQHPGALPRSRLDWKRFVVGGILVATDWTAVLACLVGCWGLRNGPMVLLWPGLGPLYPIDSYLENLYLLSPWILAFAEAGLYVRRVVFWDEVRQVIRGCTVAVGDDRRTVGQGLDDRHGHALQPTRREHQDRCMRDLLHGLGSPKAAKHLHVRK